MLMIYFLFFLLYRNSGHTGDEQLRSMYDTLTVAADARNYDLTVSSRSELMKHTIPEATAGHEFVTKSCLSDSDFNNTQQPTSAFSFARADSQIRNLPAFSSELVIILLVILFLLFLLDIGVL